MPSGSLFSKTNGGTGRRPIYLCSLQPLGTGGFVPPRGPRVGRPQAGGKKATLKLTEARSPWLTVMVHFNGQLEEIQNRLEEPLGVRAERARASDWVTGGRKTHLLWVVPFPAWPPRLYEKERERVEPQQSLPFPLWTGHNQLLQAPAFARTETLTRSPHPEIRPQEGEAETRGARRKF